MERSDLTLPASLQTSMWRELESGFLPVQNYTPSIVLEDEEELNKIEWSKIKLHKKDLNVSRTEAFKIGDYVYHPAFGYLKLEKLNLVGEKENLKSKDNTWDCIIQNSEHVLVKQEDTKVTLNP